VHLNMHSHGPADASRVIDERGFVVASSSHPHPVARDALGFVALTATELPEVARTTLHLFAEHQGTKHDELWGERPGRIPHEIILSWKGGRYLGISVDEGASVVSYFSADATAEWLIALAVAVAGGEDKLAADLNAHIQAAGENLLAELGVGGGLVRWQRPARFAGTGLEAQGWRDAATLDGAKAAGWLCPLHPDGTAPRTPFADWDTQAVVLVALRALMRLTDDARYGDAARSLQRRLQRDYDSDTLGLDGDDVPVSGSGSQPGVMLWAGALTGRRASALAAALRREDIATPWGPRTLSAYAPLHDPVHTRRGRVYAHDAYRAACGLHRIGLIDEAERMAAGIAAAIDTIGNYPIAWAVSEPGRLHAVAEGDSAWTIAVRAAIANGIWHTAAGLCEPI
jgi:glycogen debranching enzyme